MSHLIPSVLPIRGSAIAPGITGHKSTRTKTRSVLRTSDPTEQLLDEGVTKATALLSGVGLQCGTLSDAAVDQWVYPISYTTLATKGVGRKIVGKRPLNPARSSTNLISIVDTR